MSTNTNKRSLEAALDDANEFRRLFMASCFESWEFAGSVRRRCREVGDVDHVIIPRYGEIQIGNNLLAATERRNLLWHHLDAMVAGMRLSKHVRDSGTTCWGEKHRSVFFKGFVHEIYLADADNLGSVLAIRTGPGEFSKSLVINLQRQGYRNDGGYVWNKRALSCACGWRGSEAARGAFPTDHQPKFQNGIEEALLCPACSRGDKLQMARVAVPTEEEYFRLCGMRWIKPEDRR